jgi:sec-independent protein translocase protein TatC
VADLDPIDKARKAVAERAELPGMSLMEHLTELRKRLIHSVYYLIGGFAIAYAFHVRLYNYIMAPYTALGLGGLSILHPTDALNLYLKTSFVLGAIFASPFILYQVWLFIAPGMYSNEKRYVVPFMSATILLFLSGAWFGYYYVLPKAMVVLILDFGKQFHPIITTEDYTSFFLAVILGLGITFELPILIFFLSLFGIVDAKFLVKHIRYAILAIFLIAAIICPTPDPIGMCLFATPMLVLYMIGVGVAYLVHPARRKAREAKKVA